MDRDEEPGYVDQVARLFQEAYGGNGTELNGDLVDLCWQADVDPDIAVRLLYENYQAEVWTKQPGFEIDPDGAIPAEYLHGISAPVGTWLTYERREDGWYLLQPRRGEEHG